MLPPWTLPAKLAVSGVISTVIVSWWAGRSMGVLDRSGEAMQRGAAPHVTWPQHRRGPILADGVMRRIRVVLGFQAQTVALAVNAAFGAGEAAVEEVAGIELQGRLA